MRSSTSEKVCEWQKDVLLSSFSTYKIGGPAKYFTQITCQEECEDAMRFCRENGLDFYVLGRGSNTLFDDRGFDGAVIYNRLQGFTSEGSVFEVGSGASFARFGVQTAKLEFGGLEFAAGIPGSVGGAIYMNAGACGQEVSQVLKSVFFLHLSGQLQNYARKELSYSYRKSSFQKLKGIILSAKFNLYQYDKAREKQMEMMMKRLASQPYDEPSCGCVFENGEAYKAGHLIDSLGLKNLQVGGAKVSDLHANFIVNAGGAKAADIKSLVEKIEKEVYEKKGIILNREIRFVPYKRVR